MVDTIGGGAVPVSPGQSDCVLQVSQWTLEEGYTYYGTNVPYPIEPTAGDGQIIEIDIPYDDAFLYLPSNVGTDVSFLLRFTSSNEEAASISLALDYSASKRIKFRASDFPKTNFKVLLSSTGEPHIQMVDLVPALWEVNAIEGSFPSVPSEYRDNVPFISINTTDTIINSFTLIVGDTIVPYFRDSVQITITGNSGRINALSIGTAVCPHPVYPGDVLRLITDPASGYFNQLLVVDRTSYVAPAAGMVIVNSASTDIDVTSQDFTYPGGFMWNTTSASDVTVSFPTPSTLGLDAGQSINIRQGGTGAVTILATGGASIEGAASFTQQYEVKTVISKDASTWIIIGAQ